MKKALVFLFLLAFFFHTHIAFAKDNVSTDAATPIQSGPAPIEYQLPYPGLLPDSPLYFLKTLRDKIIDFLVSDPLKKAELNLLQADKRLSTGIALFAKGKDALAESTISKGENYFSDAIEKTKEAKSQGMNVKDIVRKLSLAAKKHQELLKMLEEKASKDMKTRVHALRLRMEEFEKQVDSLSPK